MAKGEGTVEELPSGRWRVRLPPRLGRRSETYDTEEQALDALKARMVFESEGTARRTLKDWGQLWLKRRAERKLSSGKDDIGRWEQHVLQSRLAHVPVKQIKPAHVAAFRDWLAKRPRAKQVLGGGYERPEEGEPISRQTQQHVLKLVQLALADAAIAGWCQGNPAAEIRTVQGQPKAEERRHLTREQVAQLLGCEAIPLQTRAAYQLAIFTGLRPGELWALRWDDVYNGGRPHLKVRQAIKQNGTVGAPKSGKPRTVPLLPQALEALRLLEGQGTELVLPAADGTHRTTGDDLGFADRSRGRQGVQRGHRALAGLPADIDFYSATRHTCATALLQGYWGQRWTLSEVRAWLGHSSITVTQRYAHEDADSLLDRAGQAQPAHEPAHALRVLQARSPTARPAGLEPATHGLEGRVFQTVKALCGPLVVSSCISLRRGSLCQYP